METTELLQIARDKSIEGRERLAQVVSDIFTEEGRVLSDKERAISFDILHHLVHDFETSVRKIVSDRLAEWPDLPPDIVNFLSNDDIDVAFPILSKSGILADENLIEIIHHRTMEHQMAIAIRKNVSEKVSDALVETGDEEVIKKLIKNQNAQISQRSMAYLVEEAKRVDSFREPIIHREDLDPKLAQQMYLWVSAALRNYITDKFEMNEEVIDDLLEKLAVESFVRMSTQPPKPKQSDTLVEELSEEGAVDPELLIKVLQDGEVSLFLSIFRKLCGLREQLVKRIVFEPGGEGLAIACCAIGISKSDFSTIFTCSRGASPNVVKDFSKEIRSALKFYSTLTESVAMNVLKQWQRDSNYLSALRQLELTQK